MYADYYSKFRENVKWVFGLASIIPVFGILITAFNISDCNTRIDNISSNISSYENSMAEISSDIDRQKEFISIIDACKNSKDSILIQHQESISSYLEDANDKLVVSESEYVNISESLEESKSNLIFQNSEANSSRDFRWVWVLILIGTSSCFVIFGLIPYDNWWVNRRRRMLENPHKIYVVTKADGTFDVVGKRGRHKRVYKTFSIDNDAYEYALKLKVENNEGHWQEIRG